MTIIPVLPTVAFAEGPKSKYIQIIDGTNRSSSTIVLMAGRIVLFPQDDAPQNTTSGEGGANAFGSQAKVAPAVRLDKITYERSIGLWSKSSSLRHEILSIRMLFAGCEAGRAQPSAPNDRL